MRVLSFIYLWIRINSLVKMKTFAQLPTLRSLPLLNHSYLFLPILGKYKTEKLTEAIFDISKDLGSLFKLNFDGTFILISTKAEHTEILYRNEGKLPFRPTFPALSHFRQNHFSSKGIVPENGEEWYKFRTAINPLLNKDIIHSYDRNFDSIADEFLLYIERSRKDGFLRDIFKHLLLYSAKAISVVCACNHLNIINDRQTSATIIKASEDFMNGLYGTLIEPPFWKLFKTTSYRKLESAHLTIFNLIKPTLVKEYEEYLNNQNAKQTFLTNLYRNKKLAWNDKLMLSLEVFLAGIDATATTLAFTLYFLALHSHIQEEVRCELLQNNDRLLKACIKETLRLRPTAGAFSRLLKNDVNMDGYLIPKNTLVSAFTSITSQSECYYKEADKYFPKRWLSSLPEYNFNHFASLPFGIGARICPGKRIAEKQMVILLKKILTAYKLECDEKSNDEIGMIFRMNRIPERSINIKFVNITNR